MTKKAKKRIRELCGLDGLNRQARAIRSKELINDDALKQSICNTLIGTSFRDIDKLLKEEINASKARTEEENIHEELELEVPEKLDPDLQMIRRNKKPIKRGFYTKADSLRLIEADTSKEWLAEKIESKPASTTWSAEETYALINSCYDSRNFSK